LRQRLRDAAVGRIDDDRGAVLAVDFVVGVAGVDPEVVVAADVAGGAGRSVAADRWRLALWIAGARPLLAPRGVGLFQLADFRVGEREPAVRLGRPLERRHRGDVPEALQIRMPPRRARRRLRLSGETDWQERREARRENTCRGNVSQHSLPPFAQLRNSQFLIPDS
jgi:hypothetical protein